MEKSRILRLLPLHVVFLSPLLKSCSAATSFSFTMRQAAFIVAAIGVLYVILCLVFLFILCRILPFNKKCRCCRKGKVCPRMPSSPNEHKGKDFLPQDRFIPRKTSTAIQPMAKTPKLQSIPEYADNIIPNPVAFEEESVQSSLPYINTTNSTTTTMTTIPDEVVFQRSKSPLQSNLQNSDELAEHFARKARESLDQSNSPSPLMNEIVSELGMFQLSGKTSEYINHPNQAVSPHDETTFHEKKADLKQNGRSNKKDEDTATKSSKLPPLSPSSLIAASPTKEDISKNRSQNTPEQPASKHGIKEDEFDDEFSVEPPNVLGSSHTAPVVITSSVAPPLPPVKVKRLHEVESSSLHRLDYLKLANTPDTRSLPDIVKGGGNAGKKRTTQQNKQVFQTEVYYTPPTSSKNKTKRAPQLAASSLTAASSTKQITTSHLNPAQEIITTRSHPNIDSITAADNSVTTNTSNTVQYLKSKSIKQKSEVCVVEEAENDGNELTFI